MHPLHGDGEAFRMLGLPTDVKLTMRPAVESIMSRVRPKITALLRTGAYYNTETMIMQFKTHIWGLIETHSAGLFHACTSLLNQFDQCQDNFLNKLHCNAAAAFLNNNFAPLTLRRNIAVLGLIHKRVLGLAHPAFSNVMPWDVGISPEEYHDKQLYDHSVEMKFQRGLYNRSIFGMIAEYNRLPQYVYFPKCHCIPTRVNQDRQDSLQEWCDKLAVHVRLALQRRC